MSDYFKPDASAKLKVSPPVFASPTDAWNHFIKHPEDYPLIDDDGFDDQLDRQCDVFDKMDSFFNFKEESPEVPLEVAAGNEGAALEERSDEPAAPEEAGE